MAMLDLMNDPTYAGQTDARNAYMSAYPTNNGLPSPAAPQPGPYAQNAAGRGVSPQQYYQDYTANFHPNLTQANPSGWQDLVKALNAEGYNYTLDQRPDNMHKGLYEGGDPNKFVKILNGLDQPIWLPGGNEPGAGGGGAPQFNDPTTALYQQYLQKQMGLLDSQQAQQQQDNAALRARMPDIQASTDRLIAYLNSRAQQLQAGPYTGQQQEILRTQALDPIEADRAAANKRALQQISARGLTPESGISQDLMNQVNNVFDKARTGAQGNIAYQSIAQDQANKNQAQQLLGLIPSVQRAGATGDLSLMEAMNAAINQPGAQAVNYANQNYQLPRNAMNDALGIMGMSPNPSNTFNNALGLYNTQTQNANQSGYAWGQLLAYLMQGSPRAF